MDKVMVTEFHTFQLGDRVELSPATDRWMMGDRFGEVVAVGKERLRVYMDRSHQTVAVHRGCIYSVVA